MLKSTHESHCQLRIAVFIYEVVISNRSNRQTDAMMTTLEKTSEKSSLQRRSFASRDLSWWRHPSEHVRKREHQEQRPRRGWVPGELDVHILISTSLPRFLVHPLPWVPVLSLRNFPSSGATPSPSPGLTKAALSDIFREQ